MAAGRPGEWHECRGTRPVGSTSSSLYSTGRSPQLSQPTASERNRLLRQLGSGHHLHYLGTDLAPATLLAASTPLPELIDRVSVGVTDAAATRLDPLFFISRSQINAQMSFGVAPGRVQVRVLGGPHNRVPVDVRARNPKLFTTTMTGRGAPILVHAGYRLVSDADPAQIGEPVALFLAGLGEVTPPLAAG